MAEFHKNHKDLGSEIPEDDDSLILLPEDDPIVTENEISTTNLRLATQNQLPIFNSSVSAWKIMIVDDDKEVHEVTKLALAGFVFQDKLITFISAYSAKEAKSLLKVHHDVALILLDVVMEENDSGLQVVKYIRDTLQNKIIRIILRTGQPGEAPEEDVIVNYDINDYKLKIELTQRKLFATVLTGLRAYSDLMNIEIHKTTLKQTLEAIPIGICALEKSHNQPSYVNQRALQIIGKRFDETAKDKSLVEIYQLYITNTSQLYPLNKLPLMCALRGENTYVDDIEVHRDGQVIPVESWGTPIFDNKGRVIYGIAAFQDISERKQAEANKIRLAQEREAKNVALRYSHEIETKNAKLVKFNQEKDDFLGIVAHDLKNPLSAIQGAAELMLSYHDLPLNDILELVDMIEKSSHQMFDLITDLLDVGAIEAGKVNMSFTSFDILPILINLINAYKVRAQTKNISLHFQEDLNTKYLVFGNLNMVRQVLDNLISNAVKYSPSGKNIFIRIGKKSKVVYCEVQDEGPGLSKEEQGQLFGKFSRLNPEPTGGENSTGLGLFIVKKLVEIMDGKVWCESEFGKGTTFIVTFPTESMVNDINS